MSDLIPRATIDQIDGYRRQALDLYAQAFELVRSAGEAASMAAPSGVYDLPYLGHRNSYGGTRSLEDFIALVRKPLDRSIWEHLIRSTKLDTLMDKTAKDQFRAQLQDDPPPATADNCFATMERLLGDSGDIFRRGIATAFSKLDRRFRTHDGFSIGSKIILTYFSDRNGMTGSHTDRETLLDVERTFHVLDRKPVPSRDAGVLGALATAERGLPWGPKAYEAETDYLRVRVFKNGNAHVWFKRDDLVERVNLLLAEYYGATLATGFEAAKEDATQAPGRHMAKNYGAFWSPPAVVERLLEEAGIQPSYLMADHHRRPILSVLEPSAGSGNIARAVANNGHSVDCVEIQETHIDALRRAITIGVVRCADFLDMQPAVMGLYDRVIMNPPFDRGLDIDHVNHALKFLKPGGLLVAVMSAGVEFREDKKTVAFRAMIERFRGRITDLPPGSFQESGTMVNTCLVRVFKPS